jgi:PucR C-terminal helix-turn-helix domain
LSSTVRLDDALRELPRADLTLVAGPWDARIVERVSVVDHPAVIGSARRGELVVLTRRASRAASGRGLVELLELAGARQAAAVALYGRATASPAVIAAASGARVALLAVGVGEDPAALAFAFEEVLRADPDAVLRRLVAAVAAIDHAAPGGIEAMLIAASAALDVELTHLGGRVTAEREDTAVRIGCRIVEDAIARAPVPPALGGDGGSVIMVEAVDGGAVDPLMFEALRLARAAGWRAARDGAAVVLSGDGDAADLAERLIERLPMSVACGVGAGPDEARAALTRARTAGALDVALRADAADPEGLVGELAGSPAAQSSAAGLLAPLERLGGPKAAASIETLRVYLDCWGSLTRSGEILHLHPNAVAHRMKRIRSLLPVDLDDPDQRLALQIACRARAARPTA